MKRLLGMLATGAIAIAIMAPTALALGVAPTEQGGGNPPCSGTKIDPLVSGTYKVVGGTIDIHVVSTAMGPAFWFETDTDVLALTVKGGPAFALYIDPVGGDSNLYHSIVNPKNPNGYWYGLSHLCVSSEKKDPDPK